MYYIYMYIAICYMQFDTADSEPKQKALKAS